MHIDPAPTDCYEGVLWELTRANRQELYAGSPKANVMLDLPWSPGLLEQGSSEPLSQHDASTPPGGLIPGMFETTTIRIVIMGRSATYPCDTCLELVEEYMFSRACLCEIASHPAGVLHYPGTAIAGYQSTTVTYPHSESDFT